MSNDFFSQPVLSLSGDVLPLSDSHDLTSFSSAGGLPGGAVSNDFGFYGAAYAFRAIAHPEVPSQELPTLTKPSVIPASLSPFDTPLLAHENLQTTTLSSGDEIRITEDGVVPLSHVLVPSLRQAVIDEFGGKSIDYTDANLTGLNLSGLDLSGQDFSGANLTNANLSNANLTNANLTNVNLTNANLSGANLNGADLAFAVFDGVDLSGANLSTAELEGADFSGVVSMEGVNFAGASVVDAIFPSMDARGLDLTEADLSGADLRLVDNLDKAMLRGVTFYTYDVTFGEQGVVHKSKSAMLPRDLNFLDKDLTDTTFSAKQVNQVETFEGARLTGATIMHGHITQANFTRAVLEGADIHNLTIFDSAFDDANLEGAIIKHVYMQNTSLNEANLSSIKAQKFNLNKVDFTDVNLNSAVVRESDWRGALNFYTSDQEKQPIRISDVELPDPTPADEAREGWEFIDMLRQRIGF